MYGQPLGQQPGNEYGPFQPGTYGHEAATAWSKPNREADELMAKAMQISDTLADAGTNFAFGLTTAREAMAGLLYDVARGLSREAVGNLTKSIVNQFSYTPKQTG